MSTSNNPTARIVLRRHAESLREQADRVEVLLALFGRRRLPAFDYETTLAAVVSDLCQGSKPQIISQLSSADELVARHLLNQITGTKKDKPARPKS